MPYNTSKLSEDDKKKYNDLMAFSAAYGQGSEDELDRNRVQFESTRKEINELREKMKPRVSEKHAIAGQLGTAIGGGWRKSNRKSTRKSTRKSRKPKRKSRRR
jgi:hypothetical protein